MGVSFTGGFKRLERLGARKGLAIAAQNNPYGDGILLSYQTSPYSFSGLSGTQTFRLFGAAGGSGAISNSSGQTRDGGNGGYAAGSLALQTSDTVEIYTGSRGQGGTNTDNSNTGGGPGGSNAFNNNAYNGGRGGHTDRDVQNGGGGGGGAATILTLNGTVIAVASAGGGSGGGDQFATSTNFGTGGAAPSNGQLNGEDGADGLNEGGRGGTQTSAGSGGGPIENNSLFNESGANGSGSTGGRGGDVTGNNAGGGGGGGGGFFAGGGGASGNSGTAEAYGGGGGAGSVLLPQSWSSNVADFGDQARVTQGGSGVSAGSGNPGTHGFAILGTAEP